MEKPSDPLAYERLVGMEQIRRAIDPEMSTRTFYRKWRVRIQPILMEREGWWLRKPRIRYFTFRFLLVGLMLEKCKPKDRRLTEKSVTSINN